MALFSKLDLPNPWRPLFIALDDEGWELSEVESENKEWALRPAMIFRHRDYSYVPVLYVHFINEPIWCGNSHQSQGMIIATFNQKNPIKRADSEKLTLSLVGNWESELASILDEIQASVAIESKV